MREAAFIEQNKDKWLIFENVLLNKEKISPGELSDLYIEITDHLSYAKTFYPKSNTELFLNQLAVTAHNKIYKTKKESKNKLITFYKEEFPLSFFPYRKTLILTFVIFAIFTGIGAYSSATDSDFVRSILGDAYVNMTDENISNNDPMAVYKQQGQFDMFLGITINNIMVALRTFALGIMLAVGSVMSLLQNAIMLGSFQYYFYDKGVFWESVRTIWIHGTIEISVIIIAGCAGMVMGGSIIFPGTYTRLEAFQRGVKAGTKIIISTLPFFIIAGFLEGFVTRHTEMPNWLAIIIILLSLSLIIFYYIIYPRIVFLKHQKINNQ